MPNGVFITFLSTDVRPSTHSVMEKQKLGNTAASPSMAGENNFICTVCGDGFSQYPNVLTHMAVHGPLESFSFDGSSNGFEVPREYILQENGTLTVFNGSTLSHSNVRPSSPGILPSHRSAPLKSLSPTVKSRLSTHQVIRPKTTVYDHRCEICNRVFQGLHNLHCHQQYRNPDQGFKCTLCCRIFQSNQDLMKHIQEHANQRFNSCSYCGKRFLKVDALDAHQKENHSSLLKTPLFIKSENKAEKKPEKQYSCKKCKFDFFWLSDLQLHSLYYCRGLETKDSFSPDAESNPVFPNMENTKVMEYYSNGATLRFTNEDRKVFRDSKDELAADFTFTPYRCGLCGDRFQDLTTLKQHHFTHQTQEEIDKLNEESKFTFQPAPLQGRRRKYKSIAKLHPCKHCPRVFNHSSSLSRHMRYHKGTMHTCSICARRFPQRCDLKRHQAMYHKNELENKPILKLLYVAPQNEPSPNLPDDDPETDALKYVGEPTADEQQAGKANRTSYKCQECGKQFGLLCVYQRHLRYHKPEDLIKCPRCPAQFKNASSLERHLKNHPRDDETRDIGQPCLSPVSTGDGALEEQGTENKKGASMDYSAKLQQSASNHLYDCTECTKSFSNLELFLQHQITHTSNSNM